MFSDDEILGLVNQARASCYQGAAPGVVGAPELNISPELREKLKNVLLGVFKLLFTQFMTTSVVQQGLQRGPAPAPGPGPAEATVISSTPPPPAAGGAPPDLPPEETNP
jgi:hypothetical protein